MKHVIDALEYSTGLIDIHLCALCVRSRRIRTHFCGASLTGSWRTTAKLWTLCLNNRVITPVLEPLLVNVMLVNLIFSGCFFFSCFHLWEEKIYNLRTVWFYFPLSLYVVTFKSYSLSNAVLQVNKVESFVFTQGFRILSIFGIDSLDAASLRTEL